jgi:tRNA(fMet)-specific endonuclease VapC
VEVSILLDTNAYSALRRGHAELARRFRHAETVVMSTVVVGELLYGFRHGTRAAANEAELEDFLGRPNTRFAEVTQTTAERYSRIAASLRNKGMPIPTNDIWIAAHALETGALLLSLDQHFDAIAGLPWKFIATPKVR